MQVDDLEGPTVRPGTPGSTGPPSLFIDTRSERSMLCEINLYCLHLPILRFADEALVSEKSSFNTYIHLCNDG
jgi:hypothetical protein